MVRMVPKLDGALHVTPRAVEVHLTHANMFQDKGLYSIMTDRY